MMAALVLIEAVRRSKHTKRRDQAARKLELAMRKAFREQGKLFVRGLKKFRDYFEAERVTPNPFGGEGAKLEEALPPSEWLFVFYEVAKKTLALFVKPIDAAAQKSLEAGAVAMVADIGMDISFALDNPRAVQFLKDYGARRVAGIDDETRKQLNTILAQAADEGWSYDRTAEAITKRYREFGVGRPQEHIDSRAHLIAVTETGEAYAEGNLIVARDLQDAGVTMEKFWSTVGDNKVSDGCRENQEAGWIALENPFPSGHQRPLRFPGCRCDLLTRRKK